MYIKSTEILFWHTFSSSENTDSHSSETFVTEEQFVIMNFNNLGVYCNYQPRQLRAQLNMKMTIVMNNEIIFIIVWQVLQRFESMSTYTQSIS